MKTFVVFTDGDGQLIRVQWSSAATRPMARVYVENEITACIHMTRPQVTMLIAGLQEWLADVAEDDGHE